MENEKEEHEANIEYVPFFKRLIIYVVELCILAIPLVYLYRASVLLAFEYQSNFILLMKWILLYAFNLFFVVRFGGSIGKLLFKTRIVDAFGQYPSLSKAFLRYSFIMLAGFIQAVQEIIKHRLSPISNWLDALSPFLEIISALIWILFLIDVVTILFNPKKRALHDYLAGTYVVSKGSVLALKRDKKEQTHESR